MSWESGFLMRPDQRVTIGMKMATTAVDEIQAAIIMPGVIMRMSAPPRVFGRPMNLVT